MKNRGKVKFISYRLSSQFCLDHGHGYSTAYSTIYYVCTDVQYCTVPGTATGYCKVPVPVAEAVSVSEVQVVNTPPVSKKGRDEHPTHG